MSVYQIWEECESILPAPSADRVLARNDDRVIVVLEVVGDYGYDLDDLERGVVANVYAKDVSGEYVDSMEEVELLAPSSKVSLKEARLAMLEMAKDLELGRSFKDLGAESLLCD